MCFMSVMRPDDVMMPQMTLSIQLTGARAGCAELTQRGSSAQRWSAPLDCLSGLNVGGPLLIATKKRGPLTSEPR